MHEILSTVEYDEWFAKQSKKTKVIVAKRIEKIRELGYFGDSKNVSEYDKEITKDCVYELRWRDGKRVYYGWIGSIVLLLLYGGNKNGQDRDIKKTKNIFKKYVEAGE